MIVQFGEPVNATLKLVLAPIQTAVVPDIVAVGFGLTVTTAEPENVPVQFASETAVIEYVFELVGETDIK